MDSRGKPDRFDKVRERMFECDLKGRGISDPAVLKAMEEIRREEFVPLQYQSQAYSDNPLPIGLGQTISQPYIVALMTEELKLNPDCEVLEIGTGSGYQTAILCKLAKKVYTIERFAQLSEAAREVLKKSGINNVEFYTGDGSYGWPEQRIFDRIIVTAAVPKWPQPLLEELKENGIIVAPIGPAGIQELVAGQKRKGKIIERGVCGCRFVRLLGKYGFDEDED